MPRETTKTVAPTAQVELQYDNKEDNPLVLKIKEIITSIDEIKEGFYPKGLNMKKVYGAKAPSKADFVALRSNLRAVLKDVNAQIKVKTKRQVKPGSGFLRMVRLRPELSAFIGTEKKGLGEVYSDALLTSWFTNYFYTMKLKKGSYIVPNKELIKLFRHELQEMGVIDKNDKLLQQYDQRKDKPRVAYTGFKFIHLQRLLKGHIVTNSDTGKRVVVKPQGNERICEILADEKKTIDSIRDARTELDAILSKLDKHQSMQAKATELGDKDDFDLELNKIKKDVKSKQRDLQKLCEKALFPFAE